MEAEHVDGATERPQAPSRDDRPAVRPERRVDHVEIGGELLNRRIGRRIDDRMAQRHDVVEVARGRGETGVHAGDRAAVGLFAPGQRFVVGAVGERGEFGADLGEARGERQFAAKLVQFVEVVGERAGALAPHGFIEDLRSHVRVAVAVAADPRADAQEGRHARPAQPGAEGAERILDLAVEPRQLAEEGVVVIGEAVGDLVDHQQPLLAQHVGAPEDQHCAPQLFLDRGELGGVALSVLALFEKVGDLELADERALAPDLGRVGGKHGADQRAVEECAERLRRDVRLADVLADVVEGVGERARTRRGAGRHMGAVAANVMLVFGDVGEMREVAEGPHDRQRLVGRQAVEGRLELAPGAGLVVAMEADGGLADVLDEFKGLLALLLAHRVAEDAAEQPDVVAQRLVLVVGLGVGLGGSGRRINSHRRRLHRARTGGVARGEGDAQGKQDQGHRPARDNAPFARGSPR